MDDVRFAFRQLTRSPGFAAVAVVTLALGIGANSAIFALADATLLRPLSFADADRLIMLHERTPTVDRGTVAPFEAADWAELNHTFDAMAAMNTSRRAMIGADGSGEQIPMQMVGIRFFDVFRARPIAGRTFQASDDHPIPDALVLSERLWRTRLGSDPEIIGRRIRIDSETFTVIGVVPDTFQVLAPIDGVVSVRREAGRSDHVWRRRTPAGVDGVVRRRRSRLARRSCRPDRRLARRVRTGRATDPVARSRPSTSGSRRARAR